MTWTCKCTTVNEDWKMCNGCGADRPAGLSDMGMKALEAFNAGRRAIHAVEYEPASFRSAEVTRTEAFAFWKAARASLEAELTALREITVDARNAMVDALGVGASLMTTAQAIRALNRERIRLEDIVNQQGSDRVGKWEQREAQLATLEAENETLRERVRELESHHAAAVHQPQGGKEQPR